MMAGVIDPRVLELDGSGSDAEFARAHELHAEFGPDLPAVFLEALPRAKRYGTRASFLYHALRYARCSPDAVHLALAALGDKSRFVRFRAAELLAFAQDPSTLPALRSALAAIDDPSREDLAAAIDAIESRNHHYFQDREHSGMVSWNPVEYRGTGA